MKNQSNFSRRNWIKGISAGLAGLLIAERATAKSGTAIFNHTRALIDSTDTIKITKLEIIPVQSCRTIFRFTPR